MLGALRDAFSTTFRKLSGRGRLSEADVRDASREIRLALLAADVHFGVVKEFVDAVAAQAVGGKVLDSITPAQQFAKVVHDELVRVLGGEPVPFDFACAPPLVALIVGLQGSGKTTAAARFALWCRRRGRRPLLVPADVQRPAAIEQLAQLAARAEVECWRTERGQRATKAVKSALRHAEKIGHDTVIIDTAGRLHVDEEMMREVRDIAKEASPQRVLYVADAMTGQDAVRSARAFDEALSITGVVLTKLDGDARGGAALSVRHVTGRPILFAGVGEGLGDLEPFHPQRMAGRILGMGDVVSLVEKVAAEVREDEADGLGRAFASGRFTMEDFLSQMKMLRRMGPLEKVLGMMPGMAGIARGMDSAQMEGAMRRKEAIVLSMTAAERANPRILNGSRRKRIAQGSGQKVQEVNRFLKEFDTMEKMMKQLSRGKTGAALLKGLTSRAFS
ncbi:MAG: signal recognition particle protein [Proteobacteria bacterium]|nr:signal recognition particle protein [Pseudomonadota bacterium]